MWLWVYLFLIQHRFEFGVYQHGEVVGCLCQGSLTGTTEEVAGRDVATITRVRVLVPLIHLSTVV